MPDVASPGHKLGQMIGVFFETSLGDDLVAFCAEQGFYCDRRGARPGVRGKSRKVTWVDKYGNRHDLDYVVERGGSPDKQGQPVAFIEVAWRRYTKHSRAKTGELEGSLLYLRDSYPTCSFLGVILAGEYTDGGKNQLTSHGITVLHIPFEVLMRCFGQAGLELDYPETAPLEDKAFVIRRWQQVSQAQMSTVTNEFRQAIADEYETFKRRLGTSLLRQIEVVRVLPLFGRERFFSSIADAVSALSAFEESRQARGKFVKLEVQLRFTDGDRIEGAFHDKEGALAFLRKFL